MYLLHGRQFLPGLESHVGFLDLVNSTTSLVNREQKEKDYAFAWTS
jgi:hypothetical protein